MLVHTLQAEVDFVPESIVADIGSSTGISSDLILRLGCVVYAVEPNPEMRQAAEDWLLSNPHFHSIAATAEATTLPAQSVDFVTAG